MTSLLPHFDVDFYSKSSNNRKFGRKQVKIALKGWVGVQLNISEDSKILFRRPVPVEIQLLKIYSNICRSISSLNWFIFTVSVESKMSRTVKINSKTHPFDVF